ncbi:carbohydrate ABC transporter substrate-binding protein (CUT1 family) [Halanaerobium congolense]|uniref:Carbohydrate ABC transporter substrate-binding protein (CUT1 family) n=1 Tax=Halanaerobium congolense TaxID=54121 RepID=A0A318E0L8_9FIRM|nr:carbohydrate ABC transporter substrate-binding protein (CUT1 family) [Halanaerobium congolense]
MVIKIKSINILAVGDPAVEVYNDPKYGFLEEFQKNKQIEVNFEIVSFNKYYEELMKSFQKYKYDVVMVAGHLWLKEFVEKNYLAELKLTEAQDYNYLDIVEEIREELELDGKKYLLPSFSDGHILVYRKSNKTKNIGKKITIKELIAVVKSFEQAANPFVLKADVSEIFLDLLPYFRAEGLEPFSEAGEFLLNNETGIEAFNNYLVLKKYCNKNIVNFGNEEVKNVIQKKKVELAVTWSGQLGSVMDNDCLEKDSLDFAYLEKPWKTTWSFALNNLSQKKEAAEEFMYYITSQKVDRSVGEHCGNPTRLSNFEADREKFRWYKVVLEMLINSKNLPDLKNMGSLISSCSGEFHQALKGKISVEEALNNIEKLI